jgi:transcriptional regulator with XRE-family HTH domain
LVINILGNHLTLKDDEQAEAIARNKPMATKLFSLEIFLQQIKKLMEEKGIRDQKDFNERVGVQRAISRWKSGESRPSVDSLLMIKKLFGKSIDWLLTGEESPPWQALPAVMAVAGAEPVLSPVIRPDKYFALPLVAGSSAANYPGMIPADQVIDLVWVGKAELGARQDHNLRAVRLGQEADSMEPAIPRGSIVVIDPTETRVCPQSIYAVRLAEEGGFALKRVCQTSGHWVLVSDHPNYDPIAISKAESPDLIIGRVIWSWTSWVREPFDDRPAKLCRQA